MKTIDIPGGSASLREQEDLKVRHEQLVEGALVGAASAIIKLQSAAGDEAGVDISSINVVKLGLDRKEIAAVYELQDAKVVASLASWTLPEPIPTMDTIGDLDPALYRELTFAVRDLGTEPGVDFSGNNPTTPGFADSPTQPSDASVSVSRDEKESESTPTSPVSGESIVTGEPSPA